MTELKQPETATKNTSIMDSILTYMNVYSNMEFYVNVEF